jgi:hypothetical protein
VRRLSSPLAILVTLVLHSVRSSGVAQDEFVGHDVEFKTGVRKHVVVTVTKERLERTPSWGQQSDNPPLSARSALKIANDFRKNFAKDQPGWKWDFESLSLRHNRAAIGFRKWYWVAYYEAFPVKGGLGGGPPYLFIVVLMDGTIVKPVVKITNDDPPLPDLAGPSATSHAEGKRFMSWPEEKELVATPEWKSDMQNPPLSARRAINLATAMKNTVVKDAKDHNWEFVALDLVPNTYANRWSWEATFWAYKRPGHRANDGADLRLFVFMNGKVDRPLPPDRFRR